MGMWGWCICSFFFNDTATTEIYTLSLHDALPIFVSGVTPEADIRASNCCCERMSRSEEHTSELQSLTNLVCRLLLEKNKYTYTSGTRRWTRRASRCRRSFRLPW